MISAVGDRSRFAFVRCFAIDLLPPYYAKFQTPLIYHFLVGKPQVDGCMSKNHTCGRIIPLADKSPTCQLFLGLFNQVKSLSGVTWKVEIRCSDLEIDKDLP